MARVLCEKQKKNLMEESNVQAVTDASGLRIGNSSISGWKTLIDCISEDGRTPLDHVSEGGSENLGILNGYCLEQRKRKAIALLEEAKEKMEEFEATMSKIAGLQELKLQLEKWARCGDHFPEDVPVALDLTLKELQLDYVDLISCLDDEFKVLQQLLHLRSHFEQCSLVARP